MDTKTIEKINKVWFDTDLGKYVKYGSQNDNKKGQELIDKLFSVTPDWPGLLHNQEKQIAENIKTIINENEYDDYLKYLSVNSPEILDFMISHDILIVL